jgi:hypothetical protein
MDLTPVAHIRRDCPGGVISHAPPRQPRIRQCLTLQTPAAAGREMQVDRKDAHAEGAERHQADLHEQPAERLAQERPMPSPTEYTTSSSKATWSSPCSTSWRSSGTGSGTAFRHLAESPAGVVAALVGALGVLMVHPGVDDHLARRVAAEEKPVLLEELGAQPMPVLFAERVALSIIGPSRNGT